jgi:hypothetical protein
VPRLRRLALIATVALAGCGAQDEPSEQPPAENGWQPLPASPLSPRADAHAFWTGSQVLVVGGTDDVRCPPNADCVDRAPPLSDGAAYDPGTETWTELPDAPVPLGIASGGVVDGTLYLWVPGFEQGGRTAFLSITPGDDAWVEREAPFGPDPSMDLVAAGDQLVAYQGTQEAGVEPDLSYDPETERWSELPPDPLTPAFDRQLLWTGDALVLLGHELVAQPNSAEPSLVLAARLDLANGAWERYPDSESLGGPWGWTGDRIVNAAIGGADGGQVNNWGRTYPWGGVLDPATGSWSDLPGSPDVAADATGIWAAGGGWTISGDGWAFHDGSSTWVALRRPGAGAADEGQAAVWADDRLLVFGGARIINGRYVLVDGGWSWIPGGAAQ